MSTASTLDDRQLARIRELRAAGSPPKQIARALGVRPAVITPIIRELAREQAAAQPEPPVVGCWISPGWGQDLTIDGHGDWPDGPAPDRGVSGVVNVLVARRHRSSQVSVCGYLVDVFCLGVKNALGPEIMHEDGLRAFRRVFFGAFEAAGTPLEVPLELARHVVWGAVDYARGLGFEAARDFDPASGHLGEWRGTSDITFGRRGSPLYVAGPYDDSEAVVRTLTRSVGRDNFHFIAPIAI